MEEWKMIGMIWCVRKYVGEGFYRDLGKNERWFKMKAEMYSWGDITSLSWRLIFFVLLIIVAFMGIHILLEDNYILINIKLSDMVK